MQIKDKELAEQIENSTVTEQEFEALLEAACQPQPKPFPKVSKTKAVRQSGDCIEIDTR